MTTSPKTDSSSETHGRLHEGLDSARERAGAAYDRARERATSAVEAIEANPLGILVGGAALGMLAGALLPRGAREKELLAPIGKRIGATAAAALAAARETGQSELQNLGLTKGAAKDQARSLLQNVAQAATNAGKAAASAGRDAAKGPGATTDA
jgi:hypothetical protein